MPPERPARSGPAIVLRRWPWSESSLLLWVLTRDQGVLPLRARGCHRLKSGQLGNLDTWALVEIAWKPARQKGHADRVHELRRSRLLRRWSGLSRSPRHLAAAGILAELAELAAPEGTPSGPVFRWLTRAFQELHDAPAAERILLRRLLEGLELLGIAPDLAGLPAGEAAVLALARGRILAAGQARPEDHPRRLSPASLELLRSLKALPPDRPTPLGSRRERPEEELLTILGDFLAWHLERPPRAWRYLKGAGRRPSIPTS